jgi:hypothetical protein
MSRSYTSNAVEVDSKLSGAYSFVWRVLNLTIILASTNPICKVAPPDSRSTHLHKTFPEKQLINRSYSASDNPFITPPSLTPRLPLMLLRVCPVSRHFLHDPFTRPVPHQSPRTKPEHSNSVLPLYYAVAYWPRDTLGVTIGSIWLLYLYYGLSFGVFMSAGGG